MSRSPRTLAAYYQLIPTAPSQEPRVGSTFWLNAWLTLPLLGLLYLFNQLADWPFLPVDFWFWLIQQVPGLVRAAGLLLTVGAAIALNVQVGDALISFGEVSLFLLFILSGGLIGALHTWGSKMHLWQIGWRSGWWIGALWGSGLLIASMAQAGATPITGWSDLVGYAGVIALFMLWGATLGWANAPYSLIPSSPHPLSSSRRRFLWQLATGALVVTLASGGVGLQLARLRGRQRQTSAAKDFANPAHFPTTLRARIYPTIEPQTGAALASFQFPEFTRPRYRPETHPIGVCFSGGGPLSASASVGQMRGLQALGLLARVGAISCVSGGSWFGAPFSYAPTTIPDSTLLGDVIEPAALTLAGIATLHPHSVAAPYASLSTEGFSGVKTAMMAEISRHPNPPFSRLYARTLNEFLLKPFGLDDPHKFFTLDPAAVTEIIANNPGLQPTDFYTMRPDRPYFIAGVAQAYPLGANQRVRAVEVTPLYTGLPQFFPGAGSGGADIGGGYVESFAFDSTAPLAQMTENIVELSTPNPPFLLSDVIGSSGAAPGELLNSFLQPEWFPKFQYWSPVSYSTSAESEPGAVYSFIDGGSLEGTGIVPLLRRHYPVIVAFLNTNTALGEDDGYSVDGVSGMVTRLFGFRRTDVITLTQDAQIFPRQQFQALQDGLHRAKADQRGVWFIDSYEVIQPNVFGISPYPGEGDTPGKVTVVWVYNERNQGWWDQLPAEVQTLFDNNDPTNNLRDFPAYNIIAQNKTTAGLPQLLNLTPQQINLIAHMHCYTVMHDVGEALLALGK